MKKNFFYFKSACALEFDKVMRRVSEYAVCPPNKERIAKLLPEYDAACAATLLAQTEAARKLLTYKPSVPLVPVEEALFASLQKTEKQISLSADEIRQVGRLLKVNADLVHYYEDK